MPIYPTPVVGMVGLLDDVTQATGQGWQQASDAIYLLGVLPEAIANALEEVTLGGSEYLAVVHKMVAGRPPKVNVELEKSVQLTSCSISRQSHTATGTRASLMSMPNSVSVGRTSANSCRKQAKTSWGNHCCRA